MPDPKQTKPKEKTKIEDKSVTIENTDLKGLVIDDSKTAKETLKSINKLKKQLEQEYQEKLGLLEYEKNKIEDTFEEKKDKITKRGKSDFFYQLIKNDENKHNILSLSHSTRELLFLLMMHMDYMDNVVTIDRKYPSNEELQKLFNMSKQTFQKSLKELKEMDIVHLERKTKYRIITINPYYIIDTKTTESTYNKFKKR